MPAEMVIKNKTENYNSITALIKNNAYSMLKNETFTEESILKY